MQGVMDDKEALMTAQFRTILCPLNACCVVRRALSF